jgi:hypothetical protein
VCLGFRVLSPSSDCRTSSCFPASLKRTLARYASFSVRCRNLGARREDKSSQTPCRAMREYAPCTPHRVTRHAAISDSVPTMTVVAINFWPLVLRVIATKMVTTNSQWRSQDFSKYMAEYNTKNYSYRLKKLNPKIHR